MSGGRPAGGAGFAKQERSSVDRHPTVLPISANIRGVMVPIDQEIEAAVGLIQDFDLM